MSNSRAGTKNYAHLVRRMVYRAIENNIDAVEKAIENAIVEDPIAALGKLGWCMPRETKVTLEDETVRAEDIPAADVLALRELKAKRAA